MFNVKLNKNHKWLKKVTKNLNTKLLLVNVSAQCYPMSYVTDAKCFYKVINSLRLP